MSKTRMLNPILKLELTTIRYLSWLAEALTSVQNCARSETSLDLISRINDFIEHIAQQALDNHSDQSRWAGLEPSIALLRHLLGDSTTVATLAQTHLHTPSIEDVETLQKELDMLSSIDPVPFGGDETFLYLDEAKYLLEEGRRIAAATVTQKQ